MNLPVRRYFTLLLTYLKPQWLKTLLMVFCLLAKIAFQLINPQIIRYFLDTTSNRGPVTALMTAGGLYILTALLNQAISMASAYYSQYVAWTATNQLRSDLVAHCLSLDMGFHKTHTSGEMIERIDGDVDALSNFFSQFTVNLMSNLLLLIGMLALFFTISWKVGIVMCIFSLLALFLLSYLRRRAIPHWKEQRQMSAAYYGFLSERLNGLEDIRANGAETSVLHGFYRMLREWLPINNRAIIAWAEMSISAMLLFVCGSALALGLGLYLWNIHEITLGTAFVLFAYTSSLDGPLNSIQDEMQDLQQAEACIQRVERLFKTPSALPDTGTTRLPEGPLKIEFHSLSFSYEEREPVIRDLSFAIKPGQKLGILGRTGSGKTTVARLLFRLYDPQAGAVLINNIPLREIGLHELRRHIGMVTQDVQIFHASVRDNLTFFESSIPTTYILAILEELGLGTWYRSLPEGLDTRIGRGEGARGLSAGEAQLLACARVFLTNPGIVVLDEASSRLDPATELLIERAITRLLENRTALIIAHRLSTLQRADDILIIENGAMVEYGPRVALVNDPSSHFASLLRSENEGVLA
ncbi:MAG TPA: ABC transporter ATP-binding protein [Ktedonobacteraceae bacterium]|nr:ABC transporter ATP-binding protein [Ktedonobacteraceae bacterium]